MIREEMRQAVVDKRLEGLTYKEITKTLGVPYEFARKTCMAAGIDGKPWKDKRDAEMQAYKATGKTIKEVAEAFGVSEGTAAIACRGVASQQAEAWRKLTVDNNLEKYEEYARQRIAEVSPTFEYFDGYAGSEKPCRIRCKTCGTITTRSFAAIRRGKVRCRVCAAIEKAEREEERRLVKESEKREKAEARAARKLFIEEARRKEREQRLHPCVVCGTPTTNKYCCGRACSEKRHNHIKEVRRRAAIKGAMVDADITLQELYRRDSGVCYICGGVCDWDDKQERNGAFIAGNAYPSIDHVIPLAKGGLHSWDNVRLAHRRCNSMKAAK